MKKLFLTALEIIRGNHQRPVVQPCAIGPVENEEIFDYLFSEPDTSNEGIYRIGGPINMQICNN